MNVFRSTLVGKLSRLLLIVILVVLILVSLWSAYLQVEREQRQERDLMKYLMESIALSIEPGHDSEGVHQADLNTLSRYLVFPKLLNLQLFNSQDESLYFAGMRREDADDGAFFVLQKPLTLNNASYYIQATFRKDEFGTSVFHAFRWNIIFLLLLMVFAAPVCVAYVRRACRPILSATEHMKRQEMSDMPKRLSVSGSEEVAMFIQHYNTLVDRLERNYEVLDSTIEYNQQQFEEKAEVLAEQRIHFVLNEGKEQAKLKNDVLRKISHELRTPIQTIIGYTEWMVLESESGESEQLARHADVVICAAEKLNDMVTALLQATKGFNSQAPLKTECFSIKKMFEDTIAIARQKEDAALPKLTLNYDDMELKVNLDRTALFTCVSNIYKNAERFATDEVVVTISKLDAGIQIIIEDDGPGLDENELKQLFKPFWRAPGQTEEGLGLGLVLARESLLRIGGQLSFNTQKGHGCQVQIDIPNCVTTA